MDRSGVRYCRRDFCNRHPENKMNTSPSDYSGNALADAYWRQYNEDNPDWFDCREDEEEEKEIQ
jgi:hypothetical protein